MLLVALEDIPSSVSVIPKGSKFHELNPVQAQEYIDTKVAAVPSEQRKARNGADLLYWPGEEVVILASGPSLSEDQCQAVYNWRQRNPELRKVIAINLTFRRAPWADVLYACDEIWWTKYYEEVKGVSKSELWTQDSGAAGKYSLKLIRSKRGNGLSEEEGVVFQGESSGYQAIGLVQQSKAKSIYLLGFDNRGTHWHKDYPSPMNKVNPYNAWALNHKKLAKECEGKIEVSNCTPGSALRCYPMRDWEEVFK